MQWNAIYATRSSGLFSAMKCANEMSIGAKKFYIQWAFQGLNNDCKKTISSIADLTTKWRALLLRL